MVVKENLCRMVKSSGYSTAHFRMVVKNSIKRFIDQILMLKKGTRLSSFLFFRRNKAGNTRAIAPKESIYEKGCDEYERIQIIRCTLN